jgi:Arc-like DNA binding domain
MVHRRRDDAVTTTIRLGEDLRAMIKAVAELRGGSMNTEMVTRLEQSFEQQDAVWGRPHTVAALKVFAAVINCVEEQTGRSWVADKATAQTIEQALYRLIGTSGNVLRRDEEYLRLHRREIAIDGIMAFLRFGEFDLKTQARVAKLVGAEADAS